jgi:hypothetical protein
VRSTKSSHPSDRGDGALPHMASTIGRTGGVWTQ